MKTTTRKLLFMLFLIPGCCKADWKEDVTDALLYVSGIVVGLAVHEVSHELAARHYGEELTWNDGGWLCRNQRDDAPCNNLKKVAIAGNLGTAVVGEVLLHLPSKYRQTIFVDGIQTFNTINPITYAYKDASTNGGYLDYRYVDNRVQIALAIHAASIGYRQFSKRTWNISVVPRGVQFSAWF